MPVGDWLYLITGLAAVAFAAGAVLFLLLALFSRRGPGRSSRFRVSLSSAILCVAAIVLAVAEFYLGLLPQQMQQQPEFKPPYQWLSTTLLVLAPLFVLASAGTLVWALNRSTNRWMHFASISLSFALLFLATAGANYGIIYNVQVPRFERYMLIENRDWKTRVGDAAPDFEITMLDGSTKKLADFRGKVLLLNFFATWCGPCLHELPHMETMWKEFGGTDGFAMVIVDREETQDAVTSFQSKHGFTFPMALDPSASAFHQFAKDGIPRTYLIGRDGTILYQTMGFADIPVYERELASLRQIIREECPDVAAR